MEAIVPYLTFNGNASEALHFYAEVLGGEIEHIQTFGDVGMEVPAGAENLVMHATLNAGALKLMASDTMQGQKVVAGSNVSLALNFENEADINKTFYAMAEGGDITMPLEKTFWNAIFGMVKDKYNFLWMFNLDLPFTEDEPKKEAHD